MKMKYLANKKNKEIFNGVIPRYNNKSDLLLDINEIPNGKKYQLLKNIYNYNSVIVVAEWGNKFIIPVIKGNIYLNGGNNYVKGDGTSLVTTGLTATINDNGNSITVSALKQLANIQNSNHGNFENPKLLQIIGII